MRTEDILNNIRQNWPEALSQQTTIVLLAHRLLRNIEEAREPILHRHDLSPQEFSLLFALRCVLPLHEMRPTSLYEYLHMSSGGLTKLLQRLTERGLIERPAGAGDRRVRPVRLTPAGRTLIETVMAEVQAAPANNLLGGSDFTAVENALRDLVRRMEQDPKEASD